MADFPLHVTGLPAGCDEAQVKQIFSQFGSVQSVKVLPARSDKPDSAAIVNMASSDRAKWMLENVTGKVPQGLVQPVNIKKKIVNNDFNKGMNMKGGMWGGKGAWGSMMLPWMYQSMMWAKGKGKGKGYGGGQGGLRTFPPEKKVWVGNLPEEGVTFRELQEHFPGSKFATVMKGKGAGTGGVAFATAEEAENAIKTLNGSTLAGNTIVVDVWTKKEDEPKAA
eukprot:TRINITY_DN821_c0_g1_i1.p1 TRINITY_DN821_c0_g1~~TRINITY_DN821_c0_g1_i1.p1  ORF type:complete len:223 (+),score=74.19 TRINITY_DN821_c0_g1_i1:237-905(+)